MQTYILCVFQSLNQNKMKICKVQKFICTKNTSLIVTTCVVDVLLTSPHMKGILRHDICINNTVCPRKSESRQILFLPSFKFCFEKGLYILIIWMPPLNVPLAKIMGSFDKDSYEVMTPNLNLDMSSVSKFFNGFVFGQSTTQQKNYKNGPASKFMFEVIPWKLFHKNHCCLLLRVGK